MQIGKWKMRNGNFTAPRRRSGSVIMMTIGLLVILAMLGATFLVISHLDRKQSQAMAAKAPADPVAGGIVEQLRALLVEDLYINPVSADPNDDVVYGDYGGGTPQENWIKFVDYPLEDVAPNATIDPWLASIALDASGYWPHITNLSDEPEDSVNGVLFRAPIANDPYADTDGDGFVDAILYNTDVTNAEGEQYWAAVRCIDLSGLFCVNTAGNSDETVVTLPLVTKPVSIDLNDFLGAFLYDALNVERCQAQSPTDLEAYWNAAGEQILAPNWDYTNTPPNPPIATGTDYLPFAIGDEMYLRWYAANAPTETGRLADELPTTFANRNLLTTYNCSRRLSKTCSAARQRSLHRRHQQ